jgi:hypothetical protein
VFHFIKKGCKCSSVWLHEILLLTFCIQFLQISFKFFKGIFFDLSISFFVTYLIVSIFGKQSSVLIGYFEICAQAKNLSGS